MPITSSSDAAKKARNFGGSHAVLRRISPGRFSFSPEHHTSDDLPEDVEVQSVSPSICCPAYRLYCPQNVCPAMRDITAFANHLRVSTHYANTPRSLKIESTSRSAMSTTTRLTISPRRFSDWFHCVSDTALCTAKRHKDDARRASIVPTPIVIATWDVLSPKKSLAASSRVTRSSVIIRACFALSEPGSLKPICPVRPIPINQHHPTEIIDLLLVFAQNSFTFP